MPKPSLKLLLGLTVVCALVLAANFFVMKEREKIKRIKAEENLKIAVEEKKIVEVKLDKATKDREKALQDLAEEKKWASSLEEHLKEKEKQVQEALNKAEEKEKIIQEALAKFEAEKKRSSKLEEDLRQVQSKYSLLVKENKVLRRRVSNRVGSTPTVELEKIVVTNVSQAKDTQPKEGRILAVNKEYDFVVINLGANEVKKQEKVFIVRDGKLIAQAEVERVEEAISAATLLPEYKEIEVKEGDLVRVQ